MIRDIWEGVGEISTGPNSPSSPSSNPDVSPWPYDPVKSDQLFVESGWEDKDGDGIREYQLDDGVFEKGEKFQFEFTITKSGSSSERIVSYLRAQCLKNGIVCNPRMVDWSYYSQMLKNRDFDAMIMGWSANSPESDPKQIWHSSSILDQGDNFIQWNNSEADALIDQGRQTMNAAGRMKSWQAFHAVVHEDQPYTFLRVVPWLRFLKNDVGNVVEYPVGLDRSEFFRMQASTPTP
jgi:peptide/nickel transport system substrate-binding protein